MNIRKFALIAVLALVVAAFSAAPTFAKPDKTTIVDTALAINAETGEFSTLIAAVVGTGLVETLDGNRQFTVFAPTDAAFAALGLDADNVVDALGVETLTEILLYHVAPGRRDSGSVLESSRVRTISRDFLFPSIRDGLPFINDSQIVIPDVETDNGIIHVIDAVLLP